MYLGRIVKVPFTSDRTLSPFHCYIPIYRFKHKLIQVNFIGGGVVTNLEIVIGIDGLALPNARGFAAGKKKFSKYCKN